jgi:hypothetical protein
MPAGPSRVGQERCEPQHPPVDRHVVDLHTTLSQWFLEVAVGQAEAQVPADRQHDHIGWEAEAGKGGSRRDRPTGAVRGSHGRSLTARTTSRPTQQSQPPGSAITSTRCRSSGQNGVCHCWIRPTPRPKNATACRTARPRDRELPEPGWPSVRFGSGRYVISASSGSPTKMRSLRDYRRRWLVPRPESFVVFDGCRLSS